MKLFIAEKPSLGRAIAESIGVVGKKEGYIQCANDTIVTWCFGHLLELSSPEDYDSKFKKWDKETLPIIPRNWTLKAKKTSLQQLKVIKNLLKEASCVVNAGDPDREGQLLVDEVLEHFNYVQRCERILLASLDAKSIEKALASLKDNKEFAPLRDSARARSQADWLYGMNGTRAMTLLGQGKGFQGVLSLGRVQTPTLNLVVTRDRDIESFKPIDFHDLSLTIKHELGSFPARLEIAKETHEGIDQEGRLICAKKAEALKNELSEKETVIFSVEKKTKKNSAPLPYSLSSLQQDASGKLGMTAQTVLNTAQSLYEKTLTTYPRSDCNYLPEEQFNDAMDILSKLGKVYNNELWEKANPEIRSKAWNTKKVSAHHAIIPTGNIPSGLSSDEQAIFDLITERYALQFHKEYVYDTQKIICPYDGDFSAQIVAMGKSIVQLGWYEFSSGKKEESENLPNVTEGDEVSLTDVKVNKKKTKPLARFTEGTLISAMSNVHNFIEDKDAKQSLKENEGLGTEATRASILETLKQRGYIKASGKNLISTELGRNVIDLTPDTLKNPITTAKWESRLNKIAEGVETLSNFMKEQTELIPSLIEPILTSQGKSLKVEGVPCPDCGKALKRLPSKKEKGKFYYACFEHSSPLFFPEKNKKPVFTKKTKTQEPCPEEGCGKMMTRLESKKKKGVFFWICENRDHPLRSDDNGKIGRPFGK